MDVTALSCHFNVSGTLETFNATSFTASLAATLNVSASSVVVTNVTAGSVIVDATILMTFHDGTQLLVQLSAPALQIAGFELTFYA